MSRVFISQDRCCVWTLLRKAGWSFYAGLGCTEELGREKCSSVHREGSPLCPQIISAKPCHGAGHSVRIRWFCAQVVLVFMENTGLESKCCKCDSVSETIKQHIYYCYCPAFAELLISLMSSCASACARAIGTRKWHARQVNPIIKYLWDCKGFSCFLMNSVGTEILWVRVEQGCHCTATESVPILYTLFTSISASGHMQRQFISFSAEYLGIYLLFSPVNSLIFLMYLICMGFSGQSLIDGLAWPRTARLADLLSSSLEYLLLWRQFPGLRLRLEGECHLPDCLKQYVWHVLGQDFTLSWLSYNNMFSIIEFTYAIEVII